MIANCLVRMKQNLGVPDALQLFAQTRPPGIYKNDYLNALFAYHHQRRCAAQGSRHGAWR